jgi:hypothetical protein
MVGSGGPPIPEKEAKGDDGTRPGGVGTAGDGSVQSGKAAVDERLAERRRSFAPMSSMEEENLRERLHLAQLRQCSEIVSAEQKYTRDTFRRLFQGKELLEQLFKLFDQDRDQCLPQEHWIEFLKQRLT